MQAICSSGSCLLSKVQESKENSLIWEECKMYEVVVVREVVKIEVVRVVEVIEVEGLEEIIDAIWEETMNEAEDIDLFDPAEWQI